MPIYIYRNGASPEGPKNPLARLLSSIGALVMLALLAVVLLPVFGVVILFLIGAAAVFFIVFAVKNWLYMNGGFSSGVEGVARKVKENFEDMAPSEAAKTASGANVRRLKRLNESAQVDDAVEVTDNEDAR